MTEPKTPGRKMPRLRCRKLAEIMARAIVANTDAWSVDDLRDFIYSGLLRASGGRMKGQSFPPKVEGMDDV